MLWSHTSVPSFHHYLYFSSTEFRGTFVQAAWPQVRQRVLNPGKERRRTIRGGGRRHRLTCQVSSNFTRKGADFHNSSHKSPPPGSLSASVAGARPSECFCQWIEGFSPSLVFSSKHPASSVPRAVAIDQHERPSARSTPRLNPATCRTRCSVRHAGASRGSLATSRPLPANKPGTGCEQARPRGLNTRSFCSMAQVHQAACTPHVANVSQDTAALHWSQREIGGGETAFS